MIQISFIFYFFLHSLTQNMGLTSGLYYKTITIIIYNPNDSGQYYNTRITIVIDNTSLSLCHQLWS